MKSDQYIFTNAVLRINLTPIRMQLKIDVFATTLKKPPPISKSGLKEFLVELIVDADLVRSHILFKYFHYSIL